jgi:hypothetical protein
LVLLLSKNLKTFEDSLNTAVFTTKFVVKDEKVITHVTHDDDGSWQFHSNDNWDDDKYLDIAMIVRLDEIIEMDTTLLEISDLPYGYTANRKSKNDKWMIQKSQPKA